MGNDNFQAYASYYNLLYKDKDYHGEMEYILGLIKTYASRPVKSILNLGCGTGNHDFLFSQKGYEIHGVDLSEGMIKSAQERTMESGLIGNIAFSQGDIRTVRLNKKFDLVLSLFHVMSYQTSDADLQCVFKTADEHLNSHGLFIFDCWHGPAVLSDPPVKRTKEVEDESTHVVRIANPVMDRIKKIVDVNFEIQVRDKKNNKTGILHELHQMRYLFNSELEIFAAQSGFISLASYKWLTAEAPSENSWNVVYVFKKRD
ncbi:class I SAM-dependent methyltransferase [soil metagenome]